MKRWMNWAFCLILIGIVGWGVHSCISLISPIARQHQIKTCGE